MKKLKIICGVLLITSSAIAYQDTIISNNLTEEIVIEAVHGTKSEKLIKPIKTSIPLSTNEKLAIKYNAIIDLLKNGTTVEAVQGLEEIIREEPGFYQARVRLITIKLDTKQVVAAFKLLEQGLAIDEHNASLIKLAAKLKQEQGDLEGSLKELHKLPTQDLAHEDTQQMLAYNYYQLGFHDLAHKYYAQLIRHNSHNSKWWLGLAITQDTVGNSKNAVISYTKARVIGGLEPEVLNYIETRINTLLVQNGKT